MVTIITTEQLHIKAWYTLHEPCSKMTSVFTGRRHTGRGPWIRVSKKCHACSRTGSGHGPHGPWARV